VVIIGDTEHDLACGRGIGAFAVGVCTGRFSREYLTPHGADVLFDDLTDHAAFYREVLGR
jgi:phosphoglycolate phosphatase